MLIRYLSPSSSSSSRWSIVASGSRSSSSSSSSLPFYRTVASLIHYATLPSALFRLSAPYRSRSSILSSSLPSVTMSTTVSSSSSVSASSSSSSFIFMAPDMDLVSPDHGKPSAKKPSSSSSSTATPNLKEIPYPRPGVTEPSSDLYATVPSDTQTITEGGAIALYSKGKVFYNQVQIFNRDVSIMAIRAWDQRKCELASPKEIRRAWALRNSHQYYEKPSTTALTPTASSSSTSSFPTTLPPLRILEALGASGLRSVRYAKEIPLERLEQIVINDIEAAAIATIQKNIEFNQLQGLKNYRNQPIIYPNAGDASLVMYLASRGIALPGMEWMMTRPSITTLNKNKKDNDEEDDNDTSSSTLPSSPPPVQGAIPQTPYVFDVIDLDPYGTASPFLDSAVQAINDGGLLCITCTDMAVLAGNNMDVCHSKYGSIPVRGRHFAEQALRIVLSCVESHANKYKRTVKPLMSIAVDFYIRIFVTVHTSALACNEAPGKLGYLHQCSGCDSFWLLPKGKGGNYGRGFRNFGITKSNTNVTTDTDDNPRTQSNPSKRQRLEDAPKSNKPSSVTSTPGKSSASSSSSSSSSGTHERMHANVIDKNLSSCPHCSRPVQIAGPLWIDPIHDPDFTQRTLQLMEQSFGTDGMGNPTASTSVTTTNPPHSYYNLASSFTIPRPKCDGGSNDVQTVAQSRRRLMGILRSIVEEDNDIPLYYELGMLSSRIKSTGIPLLTAQSALINAGYRVTGVHCSPNAIKTDAPPEFLWKMLCQWFNETKASTTTTTATTEEEETVDEPTDTLASIPSSILTSTQRIASSLPHVDWSIPLSLQARIQHKKELKAQGVNVTKFIPNPQSNWGPKARAHGSNPSSTEP